MVSPIIFKILLILFYNLAFILVFSVLEMKLDFKKKKFDHKRKSLLNIEYTVVSLILFKILLVLFYNLAFMFVFSILETKLDLEKKNLS